MKSPYHHDHHNHDHHHQDKCSHDCSLEMRWLWPRAMLQLCGDVTPSHRPPTNTSVQWNRGHGGQFPFLYLISEKTQLSVRFGLVRLGYTHHINCRMFSFKFFPAFVRKCESCQGRDAVISSSSFQPELNFLKYNHSSPKGFKDSNNWIIALTQAQLVQQGAQDDKLKGWVP